MWSNPYSHRIGNDDVFEKYAELQGCREQRAVADLHTKVVITSFQRNISWTTVGRSEAWKCTAEKSHSVPGPH